MELSVAIFGALGGIGGAVGALGAWAAARKSNASAEILATIERDRRNVELTPQFQITYAQISEERAELRITLDGPNGLDRLDQIRVEIRNDTHTRGASQIAGGPTSEEVASVVWSPYRLVPGVDGADRLGRTVAVGRLHRGDWTRLALERTLPPRWVTDPGFWRREWAGKRVRLLFTCQREGQEPWVLPYETTVEPMPASAPGSPTLPSDQRAAVYRPDHRLNI